jgi:hypothetical protein
MRRASRGRLDLPSSWREVRGWEGGAGGPLVCAWPLTCGCDWDCDEGCGFGAVGELWLCALLVAGGVDMPLAMSAPAGDAIVVRVEK